MTAPVDEVATPVPAPEASSAPSPTAGGGARYRGRYRAKSSGWWRWGFPVCLTLAVLAVPVLVLAGMRVVLGSSDGRLIRTIDDPAAPGWQAIVERTPTQGLALVDSQGALDSVSVLVLSGDGAGAVIEVPGSTIAPSAGSQAGGAESRLSDVYAQQGVEGLRAAVERILGTGVGDLDEVRPSRWTDLVAPAGTLTIENPDSVAAFPAGSLELAPSRVWEYLSAQDADESDLARLARHEAFWKAWLQKIGQDPERPGIVPGEVEVGLGRFVRALSGDQVSFAVLPVTSSFDSAGGSHVPIAAEVAEMVARFVPFPAGPEGSRVTAVVLDGTGELDHGVKAAIAIGRHGAQVDKVGNHTDFDVAITQIFYYDPAMRPRAEALRDALGVGEVVLIEEPGAAAGVTIILGRDYVDVVGG